MKLYNLMKVFFNEPLVLTTLTKKLYKKYKTNLTKRLYKKKKSKPMAMKFSA